MSGKAVVRSIGWQEFEGRPAFLAVVEYIDGPPEDELTYNVIWDELPVRIVILPPPPNPQ